MSWSVVQLKAVQLFLELEEKVGGGVVAMVDVSDFYICPRVLYYNKR